MQVCFDEGEGEEEGEEEKGQECSICMTPVLNEDFTTSCSHKFHKKCLEIWCRQNNSCPNCRTKNVISDCSYQRLNVQPPLSPVSFINHSPFYHILDASGAEITPSTAPNSVGNNFGNDIFSSKYLNIFPIWNKGVSFGLLSFDKMHLYHLLSFLISLLHTY